MSSSSAAPNESRQDRDRRLKGELDKVASDLQAAQADGTPIAHMTELTPTPESTGIDFPIKIQAQMQHLLAGGDIRLALTQKPVFERYYAELVAHRAQWMAFFSVPANMLHAEHTCGILATLATLCRQAGDLDKCASILELEDDVIAKYAEHAKASRVKEAVECCEALRYKMRLIKYNMLFQQSQLQLCVPLFKDISKYEIERNFSLDESQMSFMIKAILGKPVKMKTLNRLTDDDVMKIVVAPLLAGMSPL